MKKQRKMLPLNELNNMVTLSEMLKVVKKRIDHCIKKQIPLKTGVFEMYSIGIEQLPEEYNGWKEYVDLGGRGFHINIEFQNKITLAEAIKKRNAKHSTSKK